MLLTTTPSERIGRCTGMRRFFVRFNRSDSFVHARSSVGFTIITFGFEFSVHTTAAADRILIPNWPNRKRLSLIPTDEDRFRDRNFACFPLDVTPGRIGLGTTAPGAKRTFAEKLCQLSANRQHHSISSLGPKRSDLARTV
jgi:hypothetical protein